MRPNVSYFLTFTGKNANLTGPGCSGGAIAGLRDTHDVKLPTIVFHAQTMGTALGFAVRVRQACISRNLELDSLMGSLLAPAVVGGIAQRIFVGRALWRAGKKRTLVGIHLRGQDFLVKRGDSY